MSECEMSRNLTSLLFEIIQVQGPTHPDNRSLPESFPNSALRQHRWAFIFQLGSVSYLTKSAMNCSYFPSYLLAFIWSLNDSPTAEACNLVVRDESYSFN